MGCKMVAKWPARVASLTMLSTTQCGWHMAAQMMKRPWVTLKVHPAPVQMCAWQPRALDPHGLEPRYL